MTLPPDPRRMPGVPAADPAAAVDAAMAGLAGLADRPLVEHVAVFERIHVALGDALAAGSAPGNAPG